MYYSFLIHSFTDGHLGCFQIFAVVNSTAMSIRVHIFFWSGVSGFATVELLGQKAVPFLMFWGDSVLFSTVATPVCIPTNSALQFPFLHILTWQKYCYVDIWKFIADFSAKIFMVSWLIFKSLYPFWVYFAVWCKLVVYYLQFFCIYQSSSPNTIYWRN